MADKAATTTKPAPDEAKGDGKPEPGQKVARPGAPAPGEPSGELVQPDDPRAAAELDLMLAQIAGSGPSAQEILQAIVGADSLPDQKAEQSQAAIVARILQAGDPDAVLDMGQPVGADELEQVPLEVNGVRWMKSTFEEGPGVYAVIDAVRGDNNEPVKVTTGSTNVMTQLLKLQTMGALPQRVKIVKSARPTQSGYYPYWLQPA